MSKDYSNLRRGLVLTYFWKVIREHKILFYITLLSTIIAGALDIYIPFQYLKLWNILSASEYAASGPAYSLVLYILIVNLIRWAMRMINSFSNDSFQSKVMAGLRKQAFSYMIGHSASFFANNFGGSLTQKVNKYARSFEKMMDKFVSDGLPLLVRGAGTVIAIYALIPKYAYILIIFCAVFIITALILTRYKLKYDIIAAEADTKTTGALADAIGNHSSIQLFSGHKFEDANATMAIETQRKVTVFNWHLWGAIGGIQRLYSVAVEFIIFWVAVGDWKLGLITLPIIVLIQSYLIRLIESLWNFSGLVRTFYDSFADAQEMVLVLDTPYTVIDTSNNTYPDIISGNVSFDNVTYVYDKTDTKVLNEFSLDIPSGQKIAIVGSSGAGKSTFVRLVMRLFDVTSGKITIDGIDIKDVSQENLRNQIGFVPQDPVLFHRTLMENIRYGRRDATDEEVQQAASLAHCDEFIDALPQRYNTYVGERGVKLSGGERQRVAIARAILKNAPILILDEATSALDSHSESLIQDALHTLMKGKTTIVIAHRLSTIREMDRIIVISGGRIVEDGPHEELISNKKGLYKKLWELQAGGFKTRL